MQSLRELLSWLQPMVTQLDQQAPVGDTMEQVQLQCDWLRVSYSVCVILLLVIITVFVYYVVYHCILVHQLVYYCILCSILLYTSD